MKRAAKTSWIYSLFLLISLILIFSFQNCSKANFNEIPAAQSSNAPLNLATAKTKTVSITAQPHKVDFLLIIDNSSSMSEDVFHLGSRLSAFFTSLDSNHIDWQMCIIDTNPLTNGQSYPWSNNGNSITINSKTPNLNSVILSTINYLVTSVEVNGDERGIAQAYNHLHNAAHSSCYRDKALFSPIIISDEDERSTGITDYSYVNPDPDLYNRSTGPIENRDRPEIYINAFKEKYPDKKFQAHAIVIKSDDTKCFAEQDFYTPVSYGKFYESLAALSKGTATSICEADYTRNLNQISTQIIALSQNIELDCVPSDATQMTVSPADPAVSFKVSGKNIILSYPSNKNFSVQFKYNCK